jgi:putative lipoprotein
LLLACSGGSQITGTVTIEPVTIAGPVSLGSGSVLEVSIVDADGGATVVETLPVSGSPPFPFELEVPVGEPRRDRALFARAEVRDPQGQAGRTLFRTASPIALPDQNETLRLHVVAVVPENAPTALYFCAGREVTARFVPGQVELTLSDPDGNAPRVLTLPRVISASGSRYSDGTSLFWEHRTGVRFEHGGAVLSCDRREEPEQAVG